jgi:hypothetical protein
MHHLTLDTQDTRVSFADEVRPDVIATLQPLTVAGVHDLPDPPGGTIQVTVDGQAAMVTVNRDGAPLVTFGVAADQAGAAKLWPLISQPAGVVGHRYDAAEPSAVPWLAVRMEVGLALHLSDAGWLGDFERCWAWAWLEASRR